MLYKLTGGVDYHVILFHVMLLSVAVPSVHLPCYALSCYSLPCYMIMFYGVGSLLTLPVMLFHVMFFHVIYVLWCFFPPHLSCYSLPCYYCYIIMFYCAGSLLTFHSIQSFIFLQQVNAIVRSIQNIEKKVNKGLLKYCAYMCPIQLLQGLKWQWHDIYCYDIHIIILTKSVTNESVWMKIENASKSRKPKRSMTTWRIVIVTKNLW